MALSRGSKWFLGFLTLMLAGVAGGLYWLSGVLGVDDIEPGVPVEFTIAPGQSLRGVSDDLRDAGVVRSATTFRLAADDAGLAQRLQPGTYELATRMETDDVIAALAAGPTIVATVRFTIIEGLPVELVLARLDEQFDHLDEDDFRAVLDARTEAGENRPGLLELPLWVPEPGEPPEDDEAAADDGADGEAAADDGGDGADAAAGDAAADGAEGDGGDGDVEEFVPTRPERREGVLEPYEGLLFPETYEVAGDATALDVLQRMVDQLVRTMATVPSEEIAAFEARDLDIYDGLIIASLIERETRIGEERPIVSGVIANRLDEGMRLQIDATVLYARGEHTNRVLFEDIEIDSPFNTYQVDGLPPSPISGFGAASLRAAFAPADHDFRFYVLAPGCEGPHVFARTLDEHNINVQAFRNAGGCG